MKTCDACGETKDVLTLQFLLTEDPKKDYVAAHEISVDIELCAACKRRLKASDDDDVVAGIAEAFLGLVSEKEEVKPAAKTSTEGQAVRGDVPALAADDGLEEEAYDPGSYYPMFD